MVTTEAPGTPEHFDAVVVGSGFGGSVTAYRLAEAGKRVAVLERGRPYPPGAFPRTPRQMSQAFWDPPAGLHGLYDVWTFRGFDSIVSSGLGGGSLIYANVLLRKDEKWFVREDPLPHGGYEKWPVSRADLDPHYDEVERMLGANPFPFDSPAYSHSQKTIAMKEAAERLGLSWRLPPLAISFASKPGAEPGLGLPIADADYGNLHGASRRTCRLSGECDIGCNEGAKNTLDHTYLSAAASARPYGADIRTGCEVRDIRVRDGGGYELTYLEHDLEHEGKPVKRAALPSRKVTCDRLVLAAGTYGTSFLLLRNRAGLPGLSPALGTRYSGNGDLLTFLLPGEKESHRSFGASRGPVITSSLRVPDAADGPPGTGRGFHIQDGGYPGFADWLMESTRVTQTMLRAGEFFVRWVLARRRAWPDNRMGRELSRLLGDGRLSAGSLPLLGMGRDVPDGLMRLRRGRLDVHWTTATSMEYFERVRGTMREIADALGAGYLDHHMWFARRIVTVHPLGGAPIGDHPAEAVCDPYGEVFGLPGLYVADGAAVPGPVGPNPSLTIAALADRMSTRMLESWRRR